MKIGIIGAGNIGGTIGRLWVSAGHDVLFAVRNGRRIEAMVAGLGERAAIGSADEAAAFGPVLLFAAPFGAWPDFALENADAMAGKVVIDAANPYRRRDGEVVDAVEALGRGAAGYVATLLPRSRVVKAFNSIAWSDLRDLAHRPSPRLAIPLVGDDQAALATATKLIEDAGYDVVPAGSLATSARIDPGACAYAQSLGADDLRRVLSM